MRKCNLIFLPFAGGSSYFYSDWQEKLDVKYNFKPIELPGRGTRFQEPLIDSFACLLEDTYIKFKKIVTDGLEYMIFGHSMGVVLAYYLLKKAEKEGLPMPDTVFLSGQNPIHLIEKEYYHRGNPKDFLNYLSDLGGLSEEVSHSEEMLKIFIPILKADMEALLNREETRTPIIPLPVKLKILCSTSDTSIDIESISEWNPYSTFPVDFYIFEGDHFYINKCSEEIIKIINDVVNKEGKKYS